MSAGFGMGLGSARPAPWWPEGASWAIETVAGGRRWNASLSCIRAGTKFAQTLAGGWQAFPANMPAITDRGLLVEGSATNLCTTHNAAPSLAGWTKSGDAAATFSIVDDTAALASAGLLDLCPTGQAYRLDNSGGSTFAMVTSAGGASSLATHTVSCFARSTGPYRVGVQNNSPSLPAGASYMRRSFVGAPSFLGALFFVLAQPGTTVWFVLNQLDPGSLTSPVIVAGATASRAPDNVSIAVPAGNWHVQSMVDGANVDDWFSGDAWSLPVSDAYRTRLVGFAA